MRSTAILGVCKILAKCWELLPPPIVTDFLKKLVMEMATDCSSPDVRCSVFKVDDLLALRSALSRFDWWCSSHLWFGSQCLSIVLDNGFSHPLLEKFLPALKYSLHDNSEKVRTAFLDMLIKVKAVRAAKVTPPLPTRLFKAASESSQRRLPWSLQFWNVCSMEHLLARLAMDSQSVSKRIVDLLFKSFFPVNESEREWCCRCVTLIQMNPMAARKFYQFAHRHTAPTNISESLRTVGWDAVSGAR